MATKMRLTRMGDKKSPFTEWLLRTLGHHEMANILT